MKNLLDKKPLQIESNLYYLVRQLQSRELRWEPSTYIDCNISIHAKLLTTRCLMHAMVVAHRNWQSSHATKHTTSIDFHCHAATSALVITIISRYGGASPRSSQPYIHFTIHVHVPPIQRGSNKSVTCVSSHHCTIIDCSVRCNLSCPGNKKPKL